MTGRPPETWLKLSSIQKDILWSLDVDGPANGYELHDRVGGVTGRKDQPVTYRALDALRDGGLVGVEQRDGRENKYYATDDGRALLAAVREWIRDVRDAE